MPNILSTNIYIFKKATATFPNSGGCWRKRADESDGPGPNESCHWQFAAWMWALIGKTVNRCFVGKRTGDASLLRNRERWLGVLFCQTPEDAPHSSDCKHDVSHRNCPFGAPVLVNSMLMIQFILVNINAPRAFRHREAVSERHENAKYSLGSTWLDGTSKTQAWGIYERRMACLRSSNLLTDIENSKCCSVTHCPLSRWLGNVCCPLSNKDSAASGKVGLPL